jgi:DNA polymerase-1
MANCAGDLDFLAPFEAGGDLYAPIMAAAGIGRKTAKVLLLAAMYGQGRESVAAGLGISEARAQQLQAGMFSAMPVTKAFMDVTRRVGEQYGKIITADGRILPIPKDPKTGKSLAYKGVNYFCQGSAYSVLADTIARLDAAGLADSIHLAMHDELVVDTEAAAAVAEVMATPPEFLLQWTGGRIPVFKTDATDMGRAWAYV